MSQLWRRLGRLVFWVLWLPLAAYFPLTRRTRVLIQVDDTILVMRPWLGHGKWILPGGGLHRGESPKAGAIREVHEEVGIQLQPGQLQSLGQVRYAAHGFRFNCHYFWVVLKQRPALRLQRLEVSEAAWLDERNCTPSTIDHDIRDALHNRQFAIINKR